MAVDAAPTPAPAPPSRTQVGGAIMAGFLSCIDPVQGHRLWAESYDSDDNPLLALERRVLQPHLDRLQGKDVADVGCGTGRWLAPAYGAGARVAGFDLTREMLLQAAAKPGLRGRLAQADAQSFVPESRFDVIVFNEVLYHLEEPLRQVERYRSYLKSDGIFITSLVEQSVRAVAISRWLRRHYETILALKMSGRSKTWMIDVFAPDASAPGDGLEGICP